MAIGKSMAARLGERHGGDRKSEEFQGANFCTLTGETRDLAAEHAGFGNHETYRQADYPVLGQVSVDRRLAAILLAASC